ncbi:hypothetical protein [Okeania sp. SIO3B5]
MYWENGADLDPDVLYSIVTNEPIPKYISRTTLDPPLPPLKSYPL